MKKRVFTILLSVVCAVTCALSLSACHQEIPAGTLKFALNYDGESYSVSDYSGDYKEIEVVIPSTYNGKPVTAIGKWAFWARRDITGVIIPDTVTSIGDRAFESCDNIKSIVLPPSVTAIGKSAFSNCSSLESIVIPESVTDMGSYAFSGCDKLQYNVYDNAKYLGNSENPYVLLIEAIDKNITACDIHEKTKIINIMAFHNCNKLSDVTIGNSVMSIGDYAFNGCSKLGSVVIPDTVTSIGAYAFDNCGGVTSVSIGNSVESIGRYAFASCYRLENITVPDTIVSIGDYAFFQCEDLKYNTYDNARYLGNSENPYVVLMKANDVKITSCTINENTKIIYDGAFRDCRKLKSITIPNSVIGIGREAFYSCSNMLTVLVGNAVVYINDFAFHGCGLEIFTAPATLKHIGSDVFGECSRLQSNVYDNGKYLGNSENPYMVFIEATDNEITRCTVHEKTKLIAGYAFKHCDSMTSITIPSSVELINFGVFNYCKNLADIIFEGTVAEWKSVVKEDSWNDDIGKITVHCVDGEVIE